MRPEGLTDDDGEVRELTAEDLAEFKPAKKRGRPRLEDPKISTTLRLDADVLEYFKAGGKGWQSRINETLRKAARLDR